MEISRRSVLAASVIAASGPGIASVRPAAGRTRQRVIATEEAFATREQVSEIKRLIASGSPSPDLRMWASFKQGTYDALLDIGDGRIAEMDRHGVDMHLLSLTSPGVQEFEASRAVGIVRDANDQLAEAVRGRPTRFAGLASFAPQDPAAAVKEIDRSLGTLKLNGLIVNSHTDGGYLDEPKYWPILEAVEAHGAALYLHPRNPPRVVAQASSGTITPTSVDLNNAIWGFQCEVYLHAVKLIMGGIFDRFPKLQIVLGHMGEGLPYWLFRLDDTYLWEHSLGQGTLRKKPSDYFRDNFAITTSGMFWEPCLQFALNVVGAHRIMFAIDYPYEFSQQGMDFLRDARIDEETRRLISHANAERLFRISPA